MYIVAVAAILIIRKQIVGRNERASDVFQYFFRGLRYNFTMFGKLSACPFLAKSARYNRHFTVFGQKLIHEIAEFFVILGLFRLKRKVPVFVSVVFALMPQKSDDLIFGVKR